MSLLYEKSSISFILEQTILFCGFAFLLRSTDEIGVDVVKLVETTKEQSVMELSGTELSGVKSLLPAVSLGSPGGRFM